MQFSSNQSTAPTNAVRPSSLAQMEEQEVLCMTQRAIKPATKTRLQFGDFFLIFGLNTTQFEDFT